MAPKTMEFLVLQTNICTAHTNTNVFSPTLSNKFK